MRMKMMCAALVVVTAASLGGCGDSVELKLQRAKIALSNDKPEQAIALVDGVLREDPNHVEATQFKAAAQMRLGQLDAARATIETLLKAQPDSPEGHRLMSDWTFRQLGSLMGRTEFTTSADLQREFDAVLALGQAEAQWVESKGKDAAESRYILARYAEADAMRHQAILRTLRADLSNFDPETREPNAEVKETLAAHEARVEERMKEAEAHLSAALEINPRHFEAIELYARNLVRRSEWEAYWQLATSTAEQKDITASVYERLVQGLMRVPGNLHPTGQRVELAQRLQVAVTKSEQSRPSWEIATALMHLMASEPEKAEPLLANTLRMRPRDPEARFFMAHALFAQRRFKEAKEILDRLAVELPRSPQVQTLHGLVLMNVDEPELAKEALRRATDLDPSDPTPRDAFLRLHAEQGTMVQAHDDLRAFWENNPSDPRAIRYKLQFEQYSGKPEAVLAVLERVEKLSPLLDDHLTILVEGYYYLQQYDKAEHFALELTRRQPDKIDGYLKLAETRLMLNKDDEVKALLEQVKAKFPDSASVNQMLGRLYLERLSFDKATELLQGVVDAEPGNMQARLLLARGLASLSLTDEAMEHVEKVLERMPDDPTAHSLAARIFQFTGQSERAADHLERIDETKLDEHTNATLLAQIRLRQGRLDEAVTLCNRALATGNNDPILRLMLAEIYSRKEQFSQVENNLLALVRQQPTNSRVYSLLARYYIEQKEFERGLNQMASLQAQSDVLSRLGQAALLSAAKRPDEAVERLVPVLPVLVRERKNEALLVADGLARLHLSRNDRARAVASYEPLLEAKLFPVQAALRQIELTQGAETPEQTIARLDAVSKLLTIEQARYRWPVVQRYMALKQFDKALALLDQWRSVEPNDPLLWRWRGEVLMSTGRPTDAIAAYSEAIKLAPENVALRIRLAQAHASNFDFPAAEAVFKEMAKIDSGAQIVALAAQGQLYVSLGLNRQAAAAFEELERVGRPSDPRVIFAMGQAYASLGQDEAAMKRLAEVPTYSMQYPAAQILLARVEQSAGRVDAARARLEALAREPRTAMAATRELLTFSVRNKQEEELLRWTDQALAIETLPQSMRQPWLNLRVTIAANRGDWKAVAETLGQLSALDRDSLRVPAARILALVQSNRMEEARVLYRATAKLRELPIGELLGFVIEERPSISTQDVPLALYLASMARGDAATAKAAAARVAQFRTFFQADLEAMASRPDVDSPEMRAAYRQLCAALVSLNIGLPQLATEHAESVLKRQPFNVTAYALLVQSHYDRDMPVENLAQTVQRSAPGSALALVLAARQHTAGKDHAAASADLRKLMEKEPDNDHTRYFLSQSLQRAGKTDDALVVLREIYGGKGQYRLLAANDLAYLLAEKGPAHLDEAHRIATEAMAQAPQFTPLLDTIGWIEHLRGNNEAAIGHLSRAVARLGGLVEVQYHLGAVYQKLGNQTWAGYHLKEAAASKDDKPEVAKAKALLKG